MLNLSDSLAAYYTLRQQKATEIPAQLRQLQQQIAAQLQALQEKEQAFLTAQGDMLEQIRSHLATDARSLLSTPQFQEFVRDLLAQIAAKRHKPAFASGIAPKPAKWVLDTLQDPLQVSNIDMIEQANPPIDEEKFSTLYCIRMVIQIGQWQQVFDIPTATAQDDDPSLYHAYSAYDEWYGAALCIQEAVERLPAVASKQRLSQELTCVMAYVAELFNLYSIAERVGFLHQLQGLENQDGDLL